MRVRCAFACSVFAHLYLLLYYLLLQVAPLLRRGLKAVARSDRVLDRVRECALLVCELHRMYPCLLRQKVRAEAFDNGSAFLLVGGGCSRLLRLAPVALLGRRGSEACCALRP